MLNMRTEIWTFCQHVDGEYELRSNDTFVCRFSRGTIKYSSRDGTLSGEVGPVSFEMTDVSRVHYDSRGILFEDSRGTRIGFLLGEGHRVTGVIMSHPDPFYPALRGASIEVRL